jgi:ABC-type transporter Mla subunit MlaD
MRFGYLFAPLVCCISACSSGKTVYVYFDDVSGLQEGAIVNVLGKKVGYVTGMDLKGRMILVELEIDKKAKIPNDSRFIIESKDLLGGKRIEIKPSFGSNYLLDLDTAMLRGSGENLKIEKIDSLITSKKLEAPLRKIVSGVKE